MSFCKKCREKDKKNRRKYEKGENMMRTNAMTDDDDDACAPIVIDE
jgi:hypothetical protein